MKKYTKIFLFIFLFIFTISICIFYYKRKLENIVDKENAYFVYQTKVHYGTFFGAYDVNGSDINYYKNNPDKLLSFIDSLQESVIALHNAYYIRENLLATSTTIDSGYCVTIEQIYSQYIGALIEFRNSLLFDQPSSTTEKEIKAILSDIEFIAKWINSKDFMNKPEVHSFVKEKNYNAETLYDDTLFKNEILPNLKSKITKKKFIS